MAARGAWWRLPAVGLLAVLLSGRCAIAESPSEYQVKAVFLYRFAQFVEWPDQAAPGPVCIGVLGPDPFGGTLESLLRGKSASGRPLILKRFKTEREARGCHIVFVSAPEGKRLRTVLEGLRGSNVLTVGESGGFCQLGGVVNFELVEDSVRLEINIDAAERAGLRVSSKLLSVARIARDGQR